MKERLEEAKRSPLEFAATAVEEERENNDVVSGSMVIESVFYQYRLPGAWFPLDPE